MFESGYIKKPWLFSLLSSLFLFLPFLFFFHPKFNTNDDIGMMLLSKGLCFVNEPTPLLLYSHYLYGYYLKAGSVFFSDVNFYALNNMALLIGSHTLLLYSLVQWNKQVKFSLYFLLIEFIFISNLSLNFQFTITASFCFVAGVVALFTSISKNKKLLLFIAACFIILGALIRFEQTGLISLFTFPMLCLLFFSSHRYTFLKFSVVFVALFVVNYGLYKHNQQHYRDAYQSEFYKDFYKLATLFSDYQLVSKIDEQTQGAFSKQYHFSKNDIFLYNHFFIPPHSVLNTDQFDVDYIKSQLKSVKPNFQIQTFKNDFLNVQILLILILSILFLSMVAKDAKDWLLKMAAVMLFVIFYIAVTQLVAIYLKHMPARVLLPLGFSIFYILWLMIASQDFFQHRSHSFLNAKTLHFILPFLVILSIYKLTNLQCTLQHIDIGLGVKLVFVLLVIVFIALKKLKGLSMQQGLTIAFIPSFLVFNLVVLVSSYQQSNRNQKEYPLVKERFRHLDKTKKYYALAGTLQLETINPFDNLHWMQGYQFISSSAFSYNPAVVRTHPELMNHFFESLTHEPYQFICNEDSFFDLIKYYFYEHQQPLQSSAVETLKHSATSDSTYQVYSLRTITSSK